MQKKICTLVLICILLATVSGYAQQLKLRDNQSTRVRKKFSLTTKLEYDGFSGEKYMLTKPELRLPFSKQSSRIKGIYINIKTARNKEKMKKLLKVLKNSQLNAIVLDIKDVTGKTAFLEQKSARKELSNLIAKFQQQGIYVIGRLAVFKDLKLSKQDKYSLQYKLEDDSSVVINSSKWTNPYFKEVWDYNLQLAQQAVELGINEIQFDYIRFPTLANDNNLVIKRPQEYSKSEIILDFLQYANNQLADQDVLLSADVFGLTTTISGDLGIGQDITKMVKYLDYISPMIYPSHYNSGSYGLEDPSANPYELISRSLADAQEKLGSSSYKLRPWLQDFSFRRIYDKKKIKAQIKAVNDRELDGWLLWNSSSNYTIEALINQMQEG